MSNASISLDGKKIGSISIDGKSIWQKKLSVDYFTSNSVLLCTETVNFNANARNYNDVDFPSLSVHKKKFVGWDKKLLNVVNDLSVFPVYKNIYTVTYKYDSDDSFISSCEYIEGDAVVYPPIPKRENYTVYKYDPNCFSISPISSDNVVYVVDVKNYVKYSCTSSYEYDNQYHDLQLKDVQSYPTYVPITTYYYIKENPELSDLSLSCPNRKNPGCIDISIRFEGNGIDVEDAIETLSIGNANIVSADFIFKNYNEEISVVHESAYYGDSVQVPDIDKKTLSSTFIRWNSDRYKSLKPNAKFVDVLLTTEIITEESTYISTYLSTVLSILYDDVVDISAFYTTRDFNVSYFNLSGNIIENQQIKYGGNSIQPIYNVSVPGYKHVCWKDANGIKIDDDKFDFVSSDISAYSYQKQICNVNLYQIYANQNKFLSSIQYLSGDRIDLSDFICEHYDLITQNYPYFLYISAYSPILHSELSNKNNSLSLLFGSKFYDYDLFRTSYILKYKNNKQEAYAKFKLNYNTDYVKVIEQDKDLYSEFFAEMIAKYSKGTNNAIVKFYKNDPVDGTICVVEDDDTTKDYDDSKFHDRTSFILKYKINEDSESKLSTDSKFKDNTDISFQLNNNRIYTQAIEDNDLLVFEHDLSKSDHSFQITDNGKVQFEIKFDIDSKWEKYNFDTITNEKIYIRAFAVHDIEQCNFKIIGYKYSNNLSYLTSKYGEKIMPDSYYIEKISSPQIMMTSLNVASKSDDIENTRHVNDAKQPKQTKAKRTGTKKKTTKKTKNKK